MRIVIVSHLNNLGWNWSRFRCTHLFIPQIDFRPISNMYLQLKLYRISAVISYQHEVLDRWKYMVKKAGIRNKIASVNKTRRKRKTRGLAMAPYMRLKREKLKAFFTYS